MTPPEYIQLKAFARIDGALLSLLWAFSFACYIIGLTNGAMSIVALVLALSSPILAAQRLRLFRDHVRDGVISFMRSWGYVVLMFFYGSLLFALLVFAYFSFLDQGYVLNVIGQMLETPEMAEVLKQYGMEQQIGQMLEELKTVRPIDVAVNLLTSNIMLGMVVGLPIAALLRSNKQVERKTK